MLKATLVKIQRLHSEGIVILVLENEKKEHVNFTVKLGQEVSYKESDVDATAAVELTSYKKRGILCR